MIGNPAGRSRVVFEGREWVLLLRGLVAIAFAVAALTWPSITQAKLVNLFGVYALSHGLLSLLGAIGGRGQPGCMLLRIDYLAAALHWSDWADRRYRRVRTVMGCLRDSPG
jgi:uncharacterized membrane protein HdeD (DUF308 family)